MKKIIISENEVFIPRPKVFKIKALAVMILVPLLLLLFVIAAWKELDEFFQFAVCMFVIFMGYIFSEYEWPRFLNLKKKTGITLTEKSLSLHHYPSLVTTKHEAELEVSKYDIMTFSYSESSWMQFFKPTFLVLPLGYKGVEAKNVGFLAYTSIGLEDFGWSINPILKLWWSMENFQEFEEELLRMDGYVFEYV